MNNDPRQMSYWQDAEGALWEALSELLVVTLMDGVGEGVKTLPANIQVLADFNWVNQSVLNFARDYRYDWIKKITETTRTQVQQAITDWMREGAPLPALEARLTPIFGAVRAEMIAATETTRVFAEGNRLAWESAGVVSKVIWQTAEDDLVCPICGPLNNTEIGIGDIDAMPPAHVNCLPGDSLVSPIGKIAGGSKRWYEGDVITIFAGKNKLTVTPNHPILTRRGWIPAHALREVDYILSYKRTERVSPFVNINEQEIVTSVKNIFDSLGLVGLRVPTSAPDFHGDGANSQVATIRANSQVVNNLQALFSKPFTELDFIFGNVEPEIALPGLCPHGKFVKRNVSAPRSVVGSLDLGGAPIMAHLLPFDSFRFGLAARLDACIDQMTANNRTADPEILSKLIFGNAGLITENQITDIRKSNFSGHVYNLQTESGLYVANGIITHNCRCFTHPVVDLELVKQKFEKIFS